MSTNINIKPVTKVKQNKLTKNKNKIKSNTRIKPYPKKKTKPNTPNMPRENNGLRAKRQCYVDVLNDPFNNPPCRLGYGTMVPTGLTTAVYRTTLTSNADGSLAIFVNPALGPNGNATTAGIHYNNSGFSTATWTSAPWSNQVSIAALSDDLRCVSVGVKVLPLVPATAVPPICYAGAISGLATDNYVAVSPSALTAYQQLQRFVAPGEISALGRPVDSDGYAFRTGIFANTSNQILDVSTPIIILSGLPASTTVAVDAICHFEYIPTSAGSSITQFSGNANGIPESVAAWWSSFEAMWAYVSPKLRAPGEALLTRSIERGFQYFA